MIRNLDDPKRGFTKGMPHYPLAGTRYKMDPTRCPHYIKPLVATFFVDSPHRHQLFQRFRCIDCGRVFDIPRDVRSAGKHGSIEVDDPRVYRTLAPNESFFQKFHKQEVHDGRHPNKTYQVGATLGGS